MTHTYHVVTRQYDGTRRYHIISAPTLAQAQDAAIMRHHAETGVDASRLFIGERILSKPRYLDIEYDSLLGSVEVRAVS